jgi:hypothetical protein
MKGRVGMQGESKYLQEQERERLRRPVSPPRPFLGRPREVPHRKLPDIRHAPDYPSCTCLV